MEERTVIGTNGETLVRRTVSGTIYGAYVKYDALNRLVYETYSNSSVATSTDLNIFVDLNSIMHAIFSDKDRTIVEDYTDIVACIINMCGHYRAFFRRLYVNTKFYLIFSFNTCEINRKFVAEYNDFFWHKINDTDKYRKIASNNFELLKALCQYLPDIFFIQSEKDFETAVIISHIIDKLHDGHPNLIISRDIYTTQLCALHPYTSYLRPIKSRDYSGRPIDASVMLPINEKADFKEKFWKLVAEVRGVKENNINDLNPLNFPLLMAMNKMPERNLHTAVTTIIKASNAIRSLGGCDMKILPSRLYELPEIASQIPVAKIESIYNTIDIPFMRQYYDLSTESKNISFVNVRDDTMLNHINSKFFANNPLDFSKL